MIVEDVSYLMALRLIDPTVAQSLLRFYPIAYALWLIRSAKDRFSFSRAALLVMLVACVGAALVIMSAAGAEFGDGWYLIVGIGLVGLTIAVIATKSQELALVADVGRRLGWTDRDLRREQSLSIVISGSRNLIAGLSVLVLALVLTTTTGLPASFWWG